MKERLLERVKEECEEEAEKVQNMATLVKNTQRERGKLERQAQN